LRQLMQTRAIRSLCYALVLALLSTIAPTPLCKPACAQLMPQYSVGVVDFINESGVQGDFLARLATDAVVVEMSKSNRYDVSITSTMMKTKMEELGLRSPLSKLDLVRLGEVLSADAMLQGVISSVVLAGSGPTRRASVTLIAQMVDQASGEIINGAVQTGTSSARVGYTADDNSLIAEAINGAAFLAVRTMIDYVIPEATVMMNIGGSQVMINKGARDGIKSGMRMIVLRDREIIGYLDVTSVDPGDAYAKVVKSMRGIQPQDKARAIFEMPAVPTALKSAPLPSGAPSHSRVGGGAASKIVKFALAVAVVFAAAMLFKGGNGAEDPPQAGLGGPVVITWDPSILSSGQNFYELQIKSSEYDFPVKTIRDPGQWSLGRTDLKGLYGPGAGTAVTYYKMDQGSTTPTSISGTVPAEGFGITHQYQLRALYREQKGVDATGVPQYGYKFTDWGNSVTATCVERVTATTVTPLNGDPLLVSQLLTDDANLRWTHPAGADQFRVKVWPVQPGTGPTWQSSIIYYGSGADVSLPVADRLALASQLKPSAFIDKEMFWRVDGRHTGDTLTGELGWAQGDTVVFVIGGTPGGP